jgi:glycosyltransferase involved in cell wall biosynthesis
MMLMNGVQPAPIVVGNFVDDKIFLLADESANRDEIRLLFVGLASPLKDYDTFFRAIELLHTLVNARIVVKIVCADTDQRREELRSRAATQLLGIEVEIISFATPHEIAGLVAWSSMLVSTSVAETFGVAVCEALMCGRPVVTTASGGVSDFVLSGVNGFIVPVGDAAAIANRILDVTAGGLIANSSEIRSSVIGKYGREAFLQKLSNLYAVS